MKDTSCHFKSVKSRLRVTKKVSSESKLVVEDDVIGL